MTSETVRLGRLQIRHGCERDIDEMNCLLAACIEAMRVDGIDQWDDVYPAAPSLNLDVQSDTLYVATLTDQTIVGSFVLNDRQEPEYSAVNWTIHGVPVAAVHRLMVRPDYQRRGVAGVLMRFVEQRAFALGFGAIPLDAFMANPSALRLYASLGCQAAGLVIFRKGPFQCFEKDVTISRINRSS